MPNRDRGRGAEESDSDDSAEIQDMEDNLDPARPRLETIAPLLRNCRSHRGGKKRKEERNYSSQG